MRNIEDAQNIDEPNFYIGTLEDYDTKMFKSNHVLQRRKDSMYPREQGIHKQDYKDILKLAMFNGLSSFRNKGIVAVTFYDTDNNLYTLLVELTDYIFVISALRTSYDKFSRNYKKINQRINLFNYKLGTKEHKVQYIKPKKKAKERNKIRFVNKAV
jgi:hypothetical protein